MANDDTDLKIGVTLDTSQLPQQVQEAETQLRRGMEAATHSVQEQGQAAVEAGGALQQAGAAGTAAASGLSKGFGRVTSVMNGVGHAIDGVSAALGVVGKVFGIVAVVSSVISVVQSLAGWLSKLKEEARGAGEKLREMWALQDKAAALKAAQEAPLRDINAHIAAQEKMLELKREELSLEAMRREFEAAAANNEDAAEQARLDRALVLKTITEDEHLAATRRVEDRVRSRTQGNAMAQAQETYDTALADRQGKESTASLAEKNLQELVAAGEKFGMVGDSVEGLRETLLKYHEADKRVEAELHKLLDPATAGDVLAGRTLEQVRASRDELAAAIRGAANYMNIQTETEGGEKVPLEQLVEDVAKAWEKQLPKLQEAHSNAQTGLAAARDAEARAEVALSGLRVKQQSENALADERRLTEDASRAAAAEAKAAEAREAAEKAAAALDTERERAELEEALSSRREKASRLRDDFQTNFANLQLHARDGQGDVMKALQALFSKAEKNPQVLEYMAGALSGARFRMGSDAYRAYGDELMSLKAGVLNRDQVQDISALIRLMMQVLRAEAQEGMAKGRLDEFGNRQKQQAYTARAQEVEGLQQKAQETDLRPLAAGSRGVENASARVEKAVGEGARSLKALERSTTRMAEAFERQAADWKRLETLNSRLESRVQKIEMQNKNSKR